MRGITMQYKYTPKPRVRTSKAIKGHGRYYNPEHHKHKDPLQREKYYAYIKHRAQANHRGELYELTEEQWMHLWTDELFEQRGRDITAYCLRMIDPDMGWCIGNVEIVTRREHFNSQWGINNDEQ